MRSRPGPDRRCTYVVPFEATGDPDDVRTLADYLSSLSTAGCEVVVLDRSEREEFEEHQRVLRWVARHVPARGTLDLVRSAADVASCDRVIVAAPDVRYGAAQLDEVCALLDLHEVVEPQEFLDPLPWWGSIEAARMLLHRGVDPHFGNGATFGFRKNVLAVLRTFDATGAADPVRRLALFGAEVHSAPNTFVRRCPPRLTDWLRERPRAADEDFDMPLKAGFFFALLPLATLLAVIGGLRVAGAYASVIAIGSLALAVRGRAGATTAFPVRTCFYAPVWLIERSLSVYWALVQKLRRAASEPVPATPGTAVGREKVASGG